MEKKKMKLEKYSFGMGDRFGKEGTAQLQAIVEINNLGIEVVPVWNKSNREHTIIGSSPAMVRKEAIEAVAACGYKGRFYTDADHINAGTVDRFIDSHDFFTLDVANFIGIFPDDRASADFMARYSKYLGPMQIPGIDSPFRVTTQFLEGLAKNYLTAIDEVQKIYSHLCTVKGEDNFIAEISVDEADSVQSPLELFFILALLNEKGVKAQTIAPKFSGMFAKGIDYIGDIKGFATEIDQDMAVIRYAVGQLGMSPNLKLSIHSGSDKFSVYPAIQAAIRKYDAGIHVKTAGTTWLEEVIGLAESGTDGLNLAKEIYYQSFIRYPELSAPYASVLHLDRAMLPEIAEVRTWNGKAFSEAITHNTSCPGYNLHMRQLMHVGYKVAAEMGDTFQDMLDKHAGVIGGKVKFNLLERHLKPLFLGIK
jgi:tagaturonate epimerase